MSELQNLPITSVWQSKQPAGAMSEPDDWGHVWRNYGQSAPECQGCMIGPTEPEASEPCPQVFNRRQLTGRGPQR